VAKRTFRSRGDGAESVDTVEQLERVKAEQARVLDSFRKVERSSATALLLSDADDLNAAVLMNVPCTAALANGAVAIENGAVVGTIHSTTRSHAETLFSIEVCVS